MLCMAEDGVVTASRDETTDVRRTHINEYSRRSAAYRPAVRYVRGTGTGVTGYR